MVSCNWKKLLLVALLLPAIVHVCWTIAFHKSSYMQLQSVWLRNITATAIILDLELIAYLLAHLFGIISMFGQRAAKISWIFMFVCAGIAMCMNAINWKVDSKDDEMLWLFANLTPFYSMTVLFVMLCFTHSSSYDEVAQQSDD